MELPGWVVMLHVGVMERREYDFVYS